MEQWSIVHRGVRVRSIWKNFRIHFNIGAVPNSKTINYEVNDFLQPELRKRKKTITPLGFRFQRDGETFSHCHRHNERHTQDVPRLPHITVWGCALAPYTSYYYAQ